MCKGDYDARTALHLACSEGHFSIVQYFIENGYFKDILVKDRWGNTPLDDAIREKHRFIQNYLKLQLKSRGLIGTSGISSSNNGMALQEKLIRSKTYNYKT